MDTASRGQTRAVRHRLQSLGPCPDPGGSAENTVLRMEEEAFRQPHQPVKCREASSSGSQDFRGQGSQYLWIIMDCVVP